MRRIFMLFLSALLLLAVVPAAHAAATFKDVPRNHWAYAAITEMAQKGIIQGYKDGTFRPNSRITRAEFAKIMVAAAQIDTDSRKGLKQTFEDVDRDHWAFAYVEMAKTYLTGYKSGSVYLYKPDEFAVREDIAVALVRLLGYDSSKRADLSVLSKFRDQSKISPKLRPYIAIALQTDLIKGFTDRTFRPQDPITRAEAASLLYRAKLDEEKIVFPVEPKPEDDLPKVTDNFSQSSLSNWRTDQATGTWVTVDNRASAYSDDARLDHYFLPLKWKEELKPERYELAVDVIADGTNGLGGLYFNGNGDKATVVFVGKDSVTIGEVTDPHDQDIATIATVSAKWTATSRLKISVNKDAYSVYLNDKYLFGQQKQSLKNTSLGLYLQKKATDDLPDSTTYFDNFSFRVLE